MVFLLVQSREWVYLYFSNAMLHKPSDRWASCQGHCLMPVVGEEASFQIGQGKTKAVVGRGLIA
jgi:hypothetical protein